MIRMLKHIVKIIFIFILIICWGKSLGYANNIENERKILNFYLEDGNKNMELVNYINENDSELTVTGWLEKSSQVIINHDLVKIADNLNVLIIRGSSNLIIKGSMLFSDDLEGCLIDENTSYKLFGSSNCIGKEITYDDRKLIIRGILKGSKVNMMVQASKYSTEILEGLSIDGTNLTLNKIEDFKLKYGIDEMAISALIYHKISKFISMIFPIIVLTLILIKIIIYLVKSKNKPVLCAIYLCMLFSVLFIFFKVTNIKISIPLDMIPNKWSDFDFWSKMGKEYKEKFEYVMYMKKYGIDIYNIENLLKSVLYSILAIIVFIINLKLIKISNIKELIIVNGISIICTFIVVLMVWFKYKFDININMIWIMYPLYLCGDYFMKTHEKYLIYEKNKSIKNKDDYIFKKTVC